MTWPSYYGDEEAIAETLGRVDAHLAEEDEIGDELLENEVAWLGFEETVMAEAERFAQKLGRDLTFREEEYIAKETLRQLALGHPIDAEQAYHEGHRLDHREPVVDRTELMMERVQDLQEEDRRAEVREVYDLSTDEGRTQWMAHRIEGRIGADHPTTDSSIEGDQ